MANLQLSAEFNGKSGEFKVEDHPECPLGGDYVITFTYK